MGGDAKQIAAVAGVTLAAAGAVVLAYHHVGPKARSARRAARATHISCVVFVDDGDAAAVGRTIRHPRYAPVSDLIAAAGAMLNLTSPRLFLESTREELLPTVESVNALLDASDNATKLVLLLATPGAPLSSAAASLPRIAPPPYGPPALPLVGNGLVLLRGPYEIPLLNAWANLFTPEKMAKWGDTVRLVLRGADPTISGAALPDTAAGQGGHAMGDPEGAGGWDDKLALDETIFTRTTAVTPRRW
ncbi:hypothetical protein Rsub_01069 [Raphidocelis subcapitata]|uniref:Uncharacterized protein n=1 Tax=Raphidocelis subcapitata TaxID=307507 RepID=A0A2V0NTV7_9CHLO|nr:hypothetical protein Rsub_01069 [Raphidocelis subcapitata]|eukprot:GBF88357.1 hypothetical protein Rsub_01069 [Raphidocelis subcapitata]